MRQPPLPSSTASTPATPTGTRRAHIRLHAQRSESPSRTFIISNVPILADKRNSDSSSNDKVYTAGSLERYERQMVNKLKINKGITMKDDTYNNAFSDSEYRHQTKFVGSPGASRKNYSPTPPSPTTGKRDAVFGSRSLPKGASSSLNYGLMLDKIHQKRQHRPGKNNDGSLSDSNYATYGMMDVQQQQRVASPFSWLQPACTYAAASSSSAATSLLHQPGNNDAYNNWVAQQMSNTGTGPLSFDITGSNESINSVSSSIQQARANSLTKAHLILHQQQQEKQKNNNIRDILPTSPPTSLTSEISSNVTQHDSNADYYGIIPYRNKFSEECSDTPSKFTSQPLSLIHI